MLSKLACAMLLGSAAVSAAHAGTITVTNGSASASVTAISAAGPAPFSLLNLGNAGISGLVSTAPVSFAGGVISFTGSSTPLSGVYDGNVTNVAASPYNGTTLASANYLVAEPGGSAVIAYTTPQSVVNLLWGSVDSYDFLNLEFLNGSTVVGSVSLNGTQISSAAGIAVNGSAPAYVSVTPGGSLSSFNTVIATASSAAFEFNIGTPTVAAVPEPATFALLATGLVGLVLRRSRRV